MPLATTTATAPAFDPAVAAVTRQFGFFSDPDPRSLAQIASTGVGGVSMGPYFAMDTSTDRTCGALVNGSPSSIAGQMAHAKSLGLRVTLKPMVDAHVYPGGGGWRAYIDPSDPHAWLEDYFTRALQPYLPVADTLVIYTELMLLSATYPLLWSSLTAKVRAAGFTGPISSDADITPTTTPWYRSLNWLGGSFYPGVDTSSEAAAARSWGAVAAQMAQSHQATGLPVYMAEVGAFNVTDAELVRFVTTMGDVLGPLPFWAGFSWWRWSQDPSKTMSAGCLAAFRSVAASWRSSQPSG
jgi:hypothetical protein